MVEMSSRTKQRRSGGLTLLLYQRSLHPEFFRILASEQVSRRGYDADIWVTDGGHVVTFIAGKTVLSEVIVVNREPLTDHGLVQSIPCRGEKYHEMTVGNNVRYMISTQEEQLTQTLYEATRREIAAYAEKRELMVGEQPANAETPATLSVLDVERRSSELLVQSFHLFDENQMVIKTQSIFEVIRNAN
jgi:hypothetical protein